ncbi:dephospho-CoA kinase [Sebaldella sp. S0638]|uniref:dephospho-CoA kinase n=1 Tax=Sebaldella sp. S0638 TaxID=2957809 RepID=UPI00209CDD6C|nr:dephospho-CoA kinase [Sebaldella sp. S0638]MCP1223995.1 dephospho-CoA kinase [Sebaldella sp. S0638]
MVLGITGGIATGKTAVSNILQEMGFDIIDMDIISREVIKLPEIIKMLTEEFGIDILTDGSVDRKKLRETVFNDKEKVDKIDDIMHPAIIKISQEKIEKLKGMKKKLIVVVIPLLFEVHLEYLADKILLVAASREKQTERIIKRDNTNKTDAENIINSQMSLDEKRLKSDYIIENNGSLSELREKVLKFLNNLNYTGENI